MRVTHDDNVVDINQLNDQLSNPHITELVIQSNLPFFDEILHSEHIIYLSLNIFGNQPNLKQIAERFPNLRTLILINSPVDDLTPLIHFAKLRILHLYDCDQLEELPDLSQSGIRELLLNNCQSLSDIQHIRTLRQTLHTLGISNCPQLTNIVNIRQLTKLSQLIFQGLNINDNQLKIINDLEQLQVLTLSDCNAITQLTDLSDTQIKSLSIKNCQNFRSLLGIQTLSNTLTLFLEISNCPQLQNIAHIEVLTKLTKLELTNLNINSLNGVHGLQSLRVLELNRLPNITSIEPLTPLTKLYVLRITHMDRLINLNGIQNSAILRDITIIQADSLMNLQPIEQLQNIKTIKLAMVPRITQLGQLPSNIEYLAVQLSGIVNMVINQPLPQLSTLNLSNNHQMRTIEGVHNNASPYLKEIQAFRCFSLNQNNIPLFDQCLIALSQDLVRVMDYQIIAQQLVNITTLDTNVTNNIRIIRFLFREPRVSQTYTIGIDMLRLLVEQFIPVRITNKSKWLTEGTLTVGQLRLVDQPTMSEMRRLINKYQQYQDLLQDQQLRKTRLAYQMKAQTGKYGVKNFMQSKPYTQEQYEQIKKGKLTQEFDNLGYVPERLDKQYELQTFYTKDKQQYEDGDEYLRQQKKKQRD